MTAKNERIVKILNELLNIYSPTGYTQDALKYIEKLLTKNGIKCQYTKQHTHKGCY